MSEPRHEIFPWSHLEINDTFSLSERFTSFWTLSWNTAGLYWLHYGLLHSFNTPVFLDFPGISLQKGFHCWNYAVDVGTGWFYEHILTGVRLLPAVPVSEIVFNESAIPIQITLLNLNVVLFYLICFRNAMNGLLSVMWAMAMAARCLDTKIREYSPIFQGSRTANTLFDATLRCRTVVDWRRVFEGIILMWVLHEATYPCSCWPA